MSQFHNRRGGGKPNIQTGLDRFFIQPSTPGPADYRILVVDSLGKPNHKVTSHVKKWINKKDPEASINIDFNKKVQQKDNHSCGLLTIFNIENLTHNRHPKVTDVHIPSKTNIQSTRQKCHNLAYLTIKGYNECNSNVNKEEEVKIGRASCRERV